MLRERAWRVASRPLSRASALAMKGLLPPILRERFGLSWTKAQALELKAVEAASRAAGPLLPEKARNFGPPYLEWRKDAIERGGMAAPAGAAGELQSAA